MEAWGKVDNAEVLAALRNLIALGRDASPAMADIAAHGENSTRMRFRTETAPDGTPWKASLRARITGGRTLTQDGHLSGSVSGSHGRDFAEWGVNRIYAAIQQFGGTIRAKGKALRFRLFGGGFATVKSVTLPARPYLGVSDTDRTDILDIIQARIWGAAHAG
ncbi:MAG: phage virion morphogenesis protein [Rhodocyclaceae bacterium]|nr:phage virion morphogenesis protein [Rhodocyclaceae bacterium]